MTDSIDITKGWSRMWLFFWMAICALLLAQLVLAAPSLPGANDGILAMMACWCGIAFMAVYSFWLGFKARTQILWAGFAAASAVLLTWDDLTICLKIQGPEVMIVAAVLLALLCHRRGLDVFAGVLWSVAVVRPTLGILIVLTLAIRRKWKTLFAMALALVVWASVFAGYRSPSELWLGVVQCAQTGLSEVGFFSSSLNEMLAQFGVGYVLVAGCGLMCVLACGAMSRSLRKMDDEFEWLLPPAFLAILWMLPRDANQVLNAVVLLPLSLAALRAKSLGRAACDLALIVLVLLRGVENSFPALPMRILPIVALVLLWERTKQLTASGDHGSAPLKSEKGKSGRLQLFLGGMGLSISTILMLTVTLLCLLLLPTGYWIEHRFGTIPVWMILEHMHESPSVLPLSDIVYLVLTIVVAVTVSLGAAVTFVLAERKLSRRFGLPVAVGFVAVALAVMANCAAVTFNTIDEWFSIRHEIACRMTKSDYFAKHFNRIDPSAIAFGGLRRNLVVIVSESLEERFAEGVLGGENLLPKLTRWRGGCFHADCQCQVAGCSFTSAALTSFFYGIPRLPLDGFAFRKDTGLYPRLAIPSIWDVFLHHGYQCAYVQGGDFVFGSKGELFPDCQGFRKLGFDDMREDPDYLAEPNKHEFGVNDEVMFKYLKRETARLENTGSPFALFALTLNPHCPEGWCSAFSPKGNRGTMAESILAQDRMISEYVDWFSLQPAASNTVIVVLGDHHYSGRIFPGKTPRRVFNAVSVPGADKSPFVRDRKFATFDWAPTFIELAGGKLPGDGHFGMGVSLLRDTETLMEGITVEDFDSKMQSSLADYWDIVLKKR